MSATDTEIEWLGTSRFYGGKLRDDNEGLEPAEYAMYMQCLDALEKYFRMAALSLGAKADRLYDETFKLWKEAEESIDAENKHKPDKDNDQEESS